MAKTTNEQTYARMGMAAMMPGIQRAIEILTGQLETFRALLNNDPHNGETSAVTIATTFPKQAGRPRGNPNLKKVNNDYWGKMSADERRVEMARRLMVRTGQAVGIMAKRKAGREERRQAVTKAVGALKKTSGKKGS